MENFDDLRAFFEEEITWLHDAAQNFEEFAGQFSDDLKTEWNLLITEFRERATMHRAVIESLRTEEITQPDSVGQSAGI